MAKSVKVKLMLLNKMRIIGLILMDKVENGVIINDAVDNVALKTEKRILK